MLSTSWQLCQPSRAKCAPWALLKTKMTAREIWFILPNQAKQIRPTRLLDLCISLATTCPERLIGMEYSWLAGHVVGPRGQLIKKPKKKNLGAVSSQVFFFFLNVPLKSACFNCLEVLSVGSVKRHAFPWPKIYYEKNLPNSNLRNCFILILFHG